MQASTLLTTVLLALTVASPLSAQDPKVDTWLAAVEMHQPGVVDDSVRTALKLPRTWALATVAKAIQLPARPPTATLVKALVLHTDAAIAERVIGERAAAKGRGGPAQSTSTSATLLDGESLGNSPRSLQWELARVIATLLATRPALNLPDGTPDPDRRSGIVPARIWYHAAGAVLQQWADGANLRVILDEGLRLFPNDATLLVYRGTLRQTFADDRVQVWIKEGSAAPRGERLPVIPRRVRENEDDLPPPDENGTAIGLSRGTGPGPATRGTMLQIGAPSLERALAERDLRRALSIEPGLAEASIRLAHVLSAKGEPQEAATLARTALDRPLPPFLDYYASMMLGRAEQALGHQAEARAAFTRAAQRFPAAQSPRLALSLLAIADGRSSDGIAALVATSGPAAARDTVDPWWSYFRQHEPDAKALLAAFREHAR